MAVLFKRIVVNNRVMEKENIRAFTIIWPPFMFSICWALTKGDWWKGKDEPVAKFLSFNWKKKSDEYRRTGLYVGRLAIVLQRKVDGGDSHEPIS